MHEDHCVHYYDLRNTKQPIMVFKGHRKAVSYAKFVSGEEIVSAYVYGYTSLYFTLWYFRLVGKLEEAVLKPTHMNDFVIAVFSHSSTDSQLKLWNVNKTHCLRSFKGHINEKNFVGLASNGDYVACGKLFTSLFITL